MKAIYNSRIIESSEQLLKTDNRAFCYGDGLFETIVTGPGRINLVHMHQERLARGCKVLGIEFPEELKGDRLSGMMDDLIRENGLKGDVRTRLTVWRNTGGRYAPESSKSSFYIDVKTTNKPVYLGMDTVGISKENHTLFSPISFAKTTNALTYVMAGREKLAFGWDEIVLTDTYGHLAETHLSNLFWTIGQQVFTPSLESGCIAGVMRTCLMSFLSTKGIQVNEVNVRAEVLNEANSIFTTNASGISYFTKLHGVEREYENPQHLLSDFLKQLRQP